jgi:hypothetical protein
MHQMSEEQLYALGMHFLYSVQKVEDGYITFTSRHRDQGNSSQEFVIEKKLHEGIQAFKEGHR